MATMFAAITVILLASNVSVVDCFEMAWSCCVHSAVSSRCPQILSPTR
jgi:hypothetical protein